ncbi:Mo-dependent nitrogenase family protein [Hyella patelloides LEGE 07179]|uniref:Mo-dependent nitrogenase family protein n=1 Tax=Hyella patelloides LEGE 07179 TaxID=945734 RepID=A0A563W0T3_9CYAN|nr:Mo-dependent nitrogenase C-terminal domain-containing protein [Hyella patelloides]VEP17270.1 Mo-dependent nitrogenase family protein [Hyella patelloides LEGE 07179]
MTEITNSSYTDSQIITWLRGLYTIAWADGNYDPEEQELITQLTGDLANLKENQSLESITPEELATGLGKDRDTAENFLRTAVLVAVADGVYSTPESELLHQFSDALEIEIAALKSLEKTLYKPEETETDNNSNNSGAASGLTPPPQKQGVNVLHPVKDWLDEMDIKDPRLARFVCKVIPPQCPFERDLNLFGRKIAHIPPLCKLNPLYDQFVGLRFRSLSYLADDCQEDISEFI